MEKFLANETGLQKVQLRNRSRSAFQGWPGNSQALRERPAIVRHMKGSPSRCDLFGGSARYGDNMRAPTASSELRTYTPFGRAHTSMNFIAAERAVATSQRVKRPFQLATMAGISVNAGDSGQP